MAQRERKREREGERKREREREGERKRERERELERGGGELGRDLETVRQTNKQKVRQRVDRPTETENADDLERN